MKNLLLIDSTVLDYNVFVDSVNTDTVPFVYLPTTSLQEIRDFLGETETIDRIGIVFENDLFLGDYFYSESNTAFFIDVLKRYLVKNIDFLACDTLRYPVWKEFYAKLQETGEVIVGASDNQTGNLKYGGDWILENTCEDIELIYFTNSIEYYTYVLGSAAYHTMVLKIGGSIWGTGLNTNGQLGDGTNVDKSAFQNITVLQSAEFQGLSVKKIACGYYCSIILMTNGTLWGTGLVGSNGRDASCNTFLKITLPDTMTGTILDVKCGRKHTVFLTSTSQLWVIGGDHNQTTFQNISPTTEEICAFSCGSDYTLVLTTSNTLWVTGENGDGQLGLLNTVDRSSFEILPKTQIKDNNDAFGNNIPIKFISGGGTLTCLVMTDNSINSAGQTQNCGINSINPFNYTLSFVKTIIDKGPINIKKISIGQDHALVLMTNGSLGGFGGAKFNNPNTSNGVNGVFGGFHSYPTLYYDIISGYADIFPLPPLRSIKAFNTHSVLLGTNNTIYLSGRNSNGQLGLPLDTTILNRFAASLTDVKSLPDEDLPFIKSITQDANLLVTINGYNLYDPVVTYSGKTITATTVNSNKLTFTANPRIDSATFSITYLGNTETFTQSFPSINFAITNITQNAAGLVTITGTGFTTDTRTVTYTNVTITATLGGSTLTFTPTNRILNDIISVSNSGSVVSYPTTFPTITNITQNAEGLVTITGTNFTDPVPVVTRSSGTTIAAFQKVNNQTLTFTTSRIVSDTFTVTNSGSTFTVLKSFPTTFHTITNITQNAAGLVTITGTNFTTNTRTVTYTNVTITATLGGSTTLSFTPTNRIVNDTFTVSNLGNIASYASLFPTIANITQDASGVITITGTNFTDTNLTVTYANGTITPTKVGSTTLTFTSNPKIVSDTFTVTNSGSTVSLAKTFPTITNITQNAAGLVTITGTNFTDTNISVSYPGKNITPTKVGSTTLTFTANPIITGTVTFNVTNSGTTVSYTQSFPPIDFTITQIIQNYVGVVTITGTNFTTDTRTVTYANGTISYTASFNSSTKLTFQPMDILVNDTFTVSNLGSVVSYASVFPTINTVTQIGNTVTVTGTNFTGFIARAGDASSATSTNANVITFDCDNGYIANQKFVIYNVEGHNLSKFAYLPDTYNNSLSVQNVLPDIATFIYLTDNSTYILYKNTVSSGNANVTQVDRGGHRIPDRNPGDSIQYSNGSLILKNNKSVVYENLGYTSSLDNFGIGASDMIDVIEVSCGARHSLYLKNDGKLFGVGQSSGIGLDAYVLTNLCSGISNFLQISSGPFHSLALTSDYKIYGAGLYKNGNLGIKTGYTDGTFYDYFILDTIANVKPVAIAATTLVSAYLDTSGSIYMTGNNTLGFVKLGLGNNNIAISTSCARGDFMEQNNFTNQSEYTMLYLKENGDLYCYSNRTITYSDPTANLFDLDIASASVPGILIESNVVDMICYRYSSYYLTKEGNVYGRGLFANGSSNVSNWINYNLITGITFKTLGGPYHFYVSSISSNGTPVVDRATSTNDLIIIKGKSGSTITFNGKNLQNHRSLKLLTTSSIQLNTIPNYTSFTVVVPTNTTSLAVEVSTPITLVDVVGREFPTKFAFTYIPNITSVTQVGNTVTINGDTLNNITIVNVGGNYTPISTSFSSVTFTMNGYVGSQTISVTDGTNTTTFTPALPTIGTITQVGNTVTIPGTNLNGYTATLGGNASPLTTNVNTINYSGYVGSHQITVTNGINTLYYSTALPTIERVTQSDNTVTLTGTNLVGYRATVGVYQTLVSTDANTITMNYSSVGSQTITVTDGINSVSFTPSLPTITSITQIGNTVTISGTNLIGYTATVGGVPSDESSNANTMTINYSGYVGSQMITVTNGTNTVYSTQALPTIGTITQVGNTVTIPGTNLNGYTATLGGISSPLTTNVNTINYSGYVGSQQITVTNGINTLYYSTALPRIDSITQDESNIVTIKGSNFTDISPDISLSSSAGFTGLQKVDDQTLIFTPNTRIVTDTFTVTNSGSSVSFTQYFPTIELITQDASGVITITGTNFTDTKTDSTTDPIITLLSGTEITDFQKVNNQTLRFKPSTRLVSDTFTVTNSGSPISLTKVFPMITNIVQNLNGLVTITGINFTDTVPGVIRLSGIVIPTIQKVDDQTLTFTPNNRIINDTFTVTNSGSAVSFTSTLPTITSITQNTEGLITITGTNFSDYAPPTVTLSSGTTITGFQKVNNQTLTFTPSTRLVSDTFTVTNLGSTVTLEQFFPTIESITQNAVGLVTLKGTNFTDTAPGVTLLSGTTIPSILKVDNQTLTFTPNNRILNDTFTVTNLGSTVSLTTPFVVITSITQDASGVVINGINFISPIVSVTNWLYPTTNITVTPTKITFTTNTFIKNATFEVIDTESVARLYKEFPTIDNITQDASGVITITGDNFTDIAPGVTLLSDTEITDFQKVNNQTLTFKPNNRIVNDTFTVTNSGSSVSYTSLFPVITSITRTGLNGIITIHGTNFINPTVSTLEGVNVNQLSNTDTKITLKQFNIMDFNVATFKVTTSKSSSVYNVFFPEISSIRQDSNKVITLFGDNLDETYSVIVAGTNVVSLIVSNPNVIVTTDQYAGSADFKLSTPGGEAYYNSNFPKITGIYRDPVGRLTVHGINFVNPNIGLPVGYASAPEFNSAQSQFRFTPVPLITTGSITVTLYDDGNTMDYTQDFPTITSFTPTTGPVQVPVVITGTYLDMITTVLFGTVPGTNLIVSTNQLTVNAPSNVKSVFLTLIDANGNRAVSTTSFVYTTTPTLYTSSTNDPANQLLSQLSLTNGIADTGILNLGSSLTTTNLLGNTVTISNLTLTQPITSSYTGVPTSGQIGYSIPGVFNTTDTSLKLSPYTFDATATVSVAKVVLTPGTWILHGNITANSGASRYILVSISQVQNSFIITTDYYIQNVTSSTINIGFNVSNTVQVNENSTYYLNVRSDTGQVISNFLFKAIRIA